MMPELSSILEKEHEEEESEISRLKDCKKEAFPLCLKASLFRIFSQSSEESLLDKILSKTDSNNCGYHLLTAREVWMIYDRIMSDFAIEIGVNVEQVIELQVLNEMESMNCLLCPLYRREVTRIRER